MYKQDAVFKSVRLLIQQLIVTVNIVRMSGDDNSQYLQLTFKSFIRNRLVFNHLYLLYRYKQMYTFYNVHILLQSLIIFRLC